MKKKFFAVALATTMVASSAMTAMAAETVAGNGWWAAGNGKSAAVALADGSSVTFNVEVAAATETETLEDGSKDNYAAFCIEATDGTSYFTATSAGDAWGAGTAVKNLVADAAKGGSYEVTMTRSGNNFTAEFVDKTTGVSLHGALSLTGNVEFADTTCYIMGQVGTLTVSPAAESSGTGSDELESATPEETTAATQETTTVVNPSGGASDVELDDVVIMDEESEEYAAIEEELAGMESVNSDKFAVGSISVAAGEKVNVSAEELGLEDVETVLIYKQNADGTLELVGEAKVIDGVISFESIGEGNYVFAAKAVVAEETTTVAEETTTTEASSTEPGKTGDTAPIAILVAIAALAAAGVVVLTKKKEA